MHNLACRWDSYMCYLAGPQRSTLKTRSHLTSSSEGPETSECTEFRAPWWDIEPHCAESITLWFIGDPFYKHWNGELPISPRDSRAKIHPNVSRSFSSKFEFKNRGIELTTTANRISKPYRRSLWTTEPWVFFILKACYLRLESNLIKNVWFSIADQFSMPLDIVVDV